MLQWMESSRIGQIGETVTSHVGEGHSLEVVHVMVLSMVAKTALAPGKRPRHVTHKIAQVRDVLHFKRDDVPKNTFLTWLKLNWLEHFYGYYY